jgi:hypothetical protein
MATTNVEEFIDTIYTEIEEIDIPDDCVKLASIVIDLSNTMTTRVQALEHFYEKKGNDAIEMIRTLSSMYQMSGSKLIEQFFCYICEKGKISSFLKTEASKCLIDYEMDHVITNVGYKTLDHICQNLSSMPTPCRVECIFLLMKSELFHRNADVYFNDFVKADEIDCEFRYTTILSLEKAWNDEIRKELYTQSVKEITFLHQMCAYLNIKHTDNWDFTLKISTHDVLRELYYKMFTISECKMSFFIKSAQLAFLLHEKNRTLYRNLSAQYLLKHCKITEEERTTIEKQLQDFALDELLDYNLRADAADILIRFGTPNARLIGTNIITLLGNEYSPARTIFEDAQNVHNKEIDESCIQMLEFLSSLPIYYVDKNPLDFNHVTMHIKKILKEKHELHCSNTSFMESNAMYTCTYCNHISEPIHFCREICEILHTEQEKIELSLKRISLDRALYSTFNISLATILLKVYTYIQQNNDDSIRQELYKRLLEELVDMCGTCSSGFASRLVNVISGFDNFNIKISFENQIISNFIGRLNAEARKITLSDSIFRQSKLEDVVELWLLHDEQYDLLFSIYTTLKSINKQDISIKRSVAFFIETYADQIEKCIQDFAERVINEMSITSSDWSLRRNFGLFFRTFVPSIRQTLSEEFKEFISETDFDLSFRKALIRYDGE